MLGFGSPAVGQEEVEEATRLEGLIEDALSGAGRDVTVRGFRGALSGRAEMDSLTLSDADGVWLSISDAVLDWNRAALLRGRLEVAELSASRIELVRPPVADAGEALQPEASGSALQLPELPVALAVDDLAAEEVVIGAEVLGQPLTVRLEGAFGLADGAGDATLSLLRIDGPRGEIALDAVFSNASGELSVDLLFDEAADGIAAGLLGLPGAPAVRLEVAGAGTLGDFTADIALATDGAERFGGQIETVAGEGDRQFDISLAGDLRPLVEPEYRAFFGTRAVLEATALRRRDGTTGLSGLTIETGALRLSGEAEIGPGGLPRSFDLAGRLASPDGGALLLPIAGQETRIREASLDVTFDAREGEAWTGVIGLEGLQREGLNAESVRLDGSGTIATDPAAVTAGFDFAAEALDFGGAAAQTAFGETVTGRADISWRDGEPVEVAALRIDGESYGAEAEGRIANLTTTLDLDGRVSLRAEDLAAFAGLAERPLRGGVEATLTGRAGVISGLADLRGTVVGRELEVGEPLLDPYIAGNTSIEAALRRTVSGLALDRLRIAAPDADITVSGSLSSTDGAVSADARLGDIAPLAEGLAGPGALSLQASMKEGVWTWELSADAMAADLAAAGTLSGAPAALLITAAGQAEASDLSAFATLARRDLGGAADLTFSARAEPSSARYALKAEGGLRGVLIGQEVVDRLLSGETDIAVDARLDGELLRIGRASLVAPGFEVSGSGAVGPDLRGLELGLEARLADIGQVVDGLSGPASVSASLRPETDTGPWGLRLAARAPEAEIDATGTLRDLAGVPEAEGEVTASVADLAPLGALVGRPLGGAVELSVTGGVRSDLSRFDVVAEAVATDARVGIPAIDRLLAGTASLRVDGARSDETIEIAVAEIDAPLLSAEASGTIGRSTAFSFSGRLADVAPFVAGFSGPLTAEGRAETRDGGRTAIDARIEGPAGAVATLSGDLAGNGETAALAISGTAPLGLANGLIAPRAVAGDARFDLRLDGPLALTSLSGRAATENAILTAPVLDIALEDIAARVDLAAGRATLDLDSRFRGGGTVRVDGPIALGGGLAADLAVLLERVRLTDPTLYQTVLDARLAIAGPLAGSAEISGRVDVGETELRIPSAVGSGGGGLPPITHIGEPAGSRATRARAGLLGEDGDGSGNGAAFGLDILVRAPNQVFVRGRGLDAELGGQVRLAGTTRNIAPAGRFDLIRGRLDILGQRLEMTEGAIELTGALDPELRLVAATRAEDVDVSIIVEGPASDPDIRFTSSPELPEDEVVALLLFGRGIETLSPLQIARLASAVATLGSSGGGLLGGIREGAGLADLDVTSGEDGGAAVRAGAYIADNIYTDVTVDTEGEAEINLNLDLSRSVTVRGSTSNTGDSGLGIFLERDY
ncbi:MAG: translocation/assembly module TamB domain-containing protein [Paracoccaceae bacterium]|nr:translocation/assembly module TamB domain-containing protein [Paracoccaceae bacterium]